MNKNILQTIRVTMLHFLMLLYYIFMFLSKIIANLGRNFASMIAYGVIIFGAITVYTISNLIYEFNSFECDGWGILLSPFMICGYGIGWMLLMTIATAIALILLYGIGFYGIIEEWLWNKYVLFYVYCMRIYGENYDDNKTTTKCVVRTIVKSVMTGSKYVYRFLLEMCCVACVVLGVYVYINFSYMTQEDLYFYICTILCMLVMGITWRVSWKQFLEQLDNVLQLDEGDPEKGLSLKREIKEPRVKKNIGKKETKMVSSPSLTQQEKEMCVKLYFAQQRTLQTFYNEMKTLTSFSSSTVFSSQIIQYYIIMQNIQKAISYSDGSFNMDLLLSLKCEIFEADILKHQIEQEAISLRFIKIEREKAYERQRMENEYRRNAERQRQSSNNQKQSESKPQYSSSGFFDGCDDISALEKRYRALAKVYHPDAQSGNEDIFKKVHSEYESLKVKLS